MSKKLRKTIIGFLFMFIVALGINAVNSNAKAASAKDFKGNLNVTYKNSEHKSKITITKVNSKKVSIKIVSPAFEDYNKFTGKIISKDTIKVTDFPNVKFKWKDKTHFTSVRKGNGFGDWAKTFRGLCFSLNNTEYSQVKKSSTVYYSSTEKRTGTPFAKLSIKKNKVIVKGKLTKGTKKSYADVKGNVIEMKKTTRTFTLANNAKFYGNGGENPEPTLITKEDAIEVVKVGKLPFVLTVKNGKVTRIDFYS